MIRKLSLAVALALGVTPMGAWALGLGDIHLNSRLNQRLQAEIDLHSVEKGALNGIKVGLASPEAFARAGINRPFELAKLRFEPERLPDGRAVIRVSSREPVREPYLNFLIEINWPKGRLVREYNLLLDPPVAYPQVVEEHRARRAPPPSRRSAPRGPLVTNASGVISRGNARGKVEGDQYGPVQPADTLWSIAARVKHPGADMNQMVMALQQANPGAFGGGNVNNLRKGEVLRIPPESEVARVDPNWAAREYRSQLRNWDPTAWNRATASGSQYTAPVAPDRGETPVKPSTTAPAGTAKPAAKPRPKDDGELKIAAAEPGAAKPGSGLDAKAQQRISRLEQELTVAQEAAESARRESEEFQSRLADLEETIGDMQRLMELKDTQMAKLQATLAEAEQARTTGETPVKTPPEAKPEVKPEPKPETQPEVQPEPKPETQPEVKPEPKPETQSEVKPQPKPEIQPEPKPEVQPEVKPESKPEPEPAPRRVVVKEEPGMMGMVDDTVETLMANPILLGAAVGAPVLLGLLVFGLRRRKKGEDDGQESILTDTDDSEGLSEDSESPMSGLTTEETSFLDNLSTTGGFSQPMSESDDLDADETSFLSDFVPSDVEALQEDTGEVDPMAEADVYIAYGRYKQAEDLIRQALDKTPSNGELRMKLFEVLHAGQNSAGFHALAAESQQAGFPNKEPEAWEKIQEMQADMGSPASGAESAAAAPDDDEEDLDLGSLGFDEMEEEEGAGSAAASAESDDDDFGDLGLDLDLGDLDTGEAEAASADDASDDLGDDLDLGDLMGDLGGDEEEGQAAGGAGDDDLGDLDLGDLMGDLGGDDDEDVADSAAEASAEDDDDFDLGDLMGDLGDDTDEPEPASAAGSGGDDDLDLGDLGLDMDFGDDGDSDSAFTNTAPPSGDEMGRDAEDFLGGLDGADESSEDQSFDLDLGDTDNALGSIPDLGSEIDSLPGEDDGLEVTGLNKASKDSDDDDLGFSLDDLGVESDGEASEADTMLDLARAYVDMGDADGARDILNEVLAGGSDAQKAEAQKLISQL